MKIQQQLLQHKELNLQALDQNTDWVMVLGARYLLEDKNLTTSISNHFPNSIVTFCSTAGEIHGDETFDNSISISSLKFEKSKIHAEAISSDDFTNSHDAGKMLADKFEKDGLKHIVLFANGSSVNTTTLLTSLHDHLESHVSISGGLAGDGPRFEKTIVGLNDQVGTNLIIALGFYGDHLKINYDTQGGWESFGPERTITKSDNNLLFEFDGAPALGLYKKYLGEYASDLANNALLYPISVKLNNQTNEVTRTILGVDEDNDSMTFAGDVPEGVPSRLMRSSSANLIAAAADATKNCLNANRNRAEFALIVNCVGRKLVLGQKIEEELEGVLNHLGEHVQLAGFYSYGSIGANCQQYNTCLHNQTFSITTFSEH